ncbi:hypothetical protein OS493_003467 [Desmophyllum pertusum]|uniref:TRAF-type domain-containing protein n=1 Tax=Desmophyllum pertusum TaxID=174260 RepID=A0A9X0A925_9CNID|nr:hypothetical protein OS493_003467 [Desmophyllum pertusum]
MPDVQAASIRFLQKSIRQQHVGNSRGECRWCQARLPLDTAKTHVTQCDQIEKPCDLCSQLFKRMEIQQHQQECEYREIVCECGTRLKKKEEANHNSTTCAFKEEPCPLNCGERVKRYLVASHSLQCFCRGYSLHSQRVQQDCKKRAKGGTH